MRVESHGLHDAVIGQHIRTHPRLFAGDQQPHRPPGVVQVSGNNAAVAAVVARSAADHGLAYFPVRLADNLRCVPPGIFHEHCPGNAVALDGQPVYAADLFTGQGK